MRSPVEHSAHDDEAHRKQSVDHQKPTTHIVVDMEGLQKATREQYGDHESLPEEEKNAFRLALEKAGGGHH